MDQRLSLVGLLVNDMARARTFYEQGLGFTPALAMDDVCFYRMNGFVLGLSGPGVWEKEEVKGPKPGPAAVSSCLRSEAEADALIERAGKTGGAHKTYWGGYSGYFADPDGNYWEAAVNPHWEITGDRRTLIP